MPKPIRRAKQVRNPPQPIARFIERLEAECKGFDPQKYNAGRGFDFSTQAILLHSTLQVAVPLWVHELEQIRAVSEEEFNRELGERTSRCANILAEKGDCLMFRGSKKGESAKVFNALAEGIACMSFCPGGVTAFGTKWEHKRVRVNL